MKLRRDFFVEVFLQVKRGRLPHAITYRRVLAQAGLAADLDTRTREYLLSQPEAGASVHIALDGKTLRGVQAVDQARALHRLAAYLPTEGVVLMPLEVAGHTNDIPMAPRVLKVLDWQGKIVTGDARLAQRGLSRLLGEAGGDYIWTVKDNQPQLRRTLSSCLRQRRTYPARVPSPPKSARRPRSRKVTGNF